MSIEKNRKETVGEYLLFNLKCRECGNIEDNRRKFIYHIKKHGYTLESYYNKFYNINRSKCLFCNSMSTWNNSTLRYNKTCSNKSCICKYANKISNESIKEKYGVDNISQLDSVKEKVKKTKKERYDTETYNNQEKNKKTCLERYGVDNGSKSKQAIIKIKESKKYINKEIFIKRTIETNRKKYGVDFISQSEEFQEICRKNNLEKYGVDHPMKNKKIIVKRKKYFLEKYGVDNISQLDSVKEKVKKTLFLKRAQRLYEKLGDRIISFPDYKTIELYCKECNKTSVLNIGFVEQRFKFNYGLCIHCTPYKSYITQENISKWIESQNIEIIREYRIGNTQKRVDIYIPKFNIGFEYNSFLYHNEKYLSKGYHYERKLLCKNHNFDIFYIWEDNWLYKQDIVKSMILNKLGKTKNKIYGRKCIVKEVSNKENKEFLNNNHIQGNCNSSIKLGLYYEEKLVSLMTFGKRKISANSQFELLRFCNKINTNVIGGASKLFKYFVNNYDINELYSYASLDYSNGNLYYNLGFTYDGHTGIDYWWCDGINKYSRHKFKKQNLVKEGYDNKKTENEIMHDRNFYKIWGPGNFRFKWVKY